MINPVRFSFLVSVFLFLWGNFHAYAHKPTGEAKVDGKYLYVSSKPYKKDLPEDSLKFQDSEFYHKIYVKSNAPAWLMLWVNAAVEYDLASHWSVALPIYYSGWDYFSSKLKFRTFSVVPEIRYWPRNDNMGFYVNGHLGLNQFNYAKGGEWRYQTYKGHTPALGGGVGVGYRWYFCKNHRWTMEASLGCGVYHLDYSIFQNIPNGLIVGRRKRTFFGIDQAALSFAYSFGVKRKEVAK